MTMEAAPLHSIIFSCFGPFQFFCLFACLLVVVVLGSLFRADGGYSFLGTSFSIFVAMTHAFRNKYQVSVRHHPPGNNKVRFEIENPSALVLMINVLHASMTAPA
jgi:hypothetical protein